MGTCNHDRGFRRTSDQEYSKPGAHGDEKGEFEGFQWNYDPWSGRVDIFSDDKSDLCDAWGNCEKAKRKSIDTILWSDRVKGITIWNSGIVSQTV